METRTETTEKIWGHTGVAYTEVDVAALLRWLRWQYQYPTGRWSIAENGHQVEICLTLKAGYHEGAKEEAENIVKQATLVIEHTAIHVSLADAISLKKKYADKPTFAHVRSKVAYMKEEQTKQADQLKQTHDLTQQLVDFTETLKDNVLRLTDFMRRVESKTPWWRSCGCLIGNSERKGGKR